MLDGLAVLCLISAIALLIALSLIDLRTRLLPNKLVLPFAICAPIFHTTTSWQFLSWEMVLLGGISGYALLYALRAIANYVYKQDALGLGDVKLMGAAGLWLGPENLMMALTLGATAGLLHGIAVAVYIAQKEKRPPVFKGLKIPAGPSFAIGIVLTGLYMFKSFTPWELWG